MTRKHSTHDQDNPFILDPVARTWANAAVQKHNLIQRDHNSEVFTFKLPRFIEGHDMSECDAVEVHFINIDAVTRKQSPGVYEVQDLRVNPEDSETIICSWVISRTATKYAGVLHFLLRFACYQEDGTEDYVWHSATDSSVVVAKGMNNGKAVVEAHVDILERWRQDLIESGGVSDQRIKTIVAEYMAEHPAETPGGISSAEKSLILDLFRNAAYTANKSATFAQLEALWSGSGNEGGDTPVVPDVPDTSGYKVTNNLTNVTNSNAQTSITEGLYSATLTVADGYSLNSVVITMGGEDITDSVYTAETGSILITEVTGDIVITAVAVEPEYLGIFYFGQSSTVYLYSDENTKDRYVNRYETYVSNLRTETATECEAVITNNTESDASVTILCGSVKSCARNSTPNLYYYTEKTQTIRAGQSLHIPFSVKAERYAMVSLNKADMDVAVIGVMDVHETTDPIATNDVGVGTTYFYSDGTTDTQITYGWTGVNKIATEPCAEETVIRLTIINPSEDTDQSVNMFRGAAVSADLAEGKKIYFAAECSGTLGPKAQNVTTFTVPAGYYPAVWMSETNKFDIILEKA